VPLARIYLRGGAFGQILPQPCSTEPPLASWTATARCCRAGAVGPPIQWERAEGDAETGVASWPWKRA